MSELLNVAQVAAILKCSPDTVVRRFAKLPGVVNLGTKGSLGKRRYRTLRIPKHVVERFIGHPVEVPALEPKRRQKRKDWETKATQELAKTIVENAEDPTSRELFKKLLANARTLTFVPAEAWDGLELWQDVEGE
jgi:hypothetical protein